MVAYRDARIFLETPHRFDDETLEWPDGTFIKLRTAYPYRLDIRDVERDEKRQMEVGRRVYRALKDAGHWRVLLVDDMQDLIDHYEPPEG